MVCPVAPATGWLSQVFGEWMQVGGADRSRGWALGSGDGIRPRAQPLALPRATRMPLGFSVFLVRACACARVCVRVCVCTRVRAAGGWVGGYANAHLTLRVVKGHG